MEYEGVIVGFFYEDLPLVPFWVEVDSCFFSAA